MNCKCLIFNYFIKGKPGSYVPQSSYPGSAYPGTPGIKKYLFKFLWNVNIAYILVNMNNYITIY